MRQQALPQGLGNLLVPLLCGYGFLIFCNCTKYRILRESGYHVLFRSAIAGLLFFAAMYLAVKVAERLLPDNPVFPLLQEFMPAENSVTLAFTVLLTVASLVLVNRIYDEISAAKKRSRGKTATSWSC